MECKDLAYRRCIDHLRSNNVDKYVSLPQIVVMGDTSSGKSSLLSMTSGIPLPSNDELTTRCAVRIRMEKSCQWSGKVGITFVESGNNDEEWLPVTIACVEDVEQAILRAQRYIIQRCSKQYQGM